MALNLFSWRGNLYVSSKPPPVWDDEPLTNFAQSGPIPWKDEFLKSSSSQEGKVMVRYTVACGKPTPEGVLQILKCVEEAPPSLYTGRKENELGPDRLIQIFQYMEEPPQLFLKPHQETVTGAFLASLANRHHDKIKHSRAWQCFLCGKPAEHLHYWSLSLISPKAVVDPTPEVVDIATPVCISGGTCDRNAELKVFEFAMNDLLKDWCWLRKINPKESCDNCGKKGEIKMCGGCKSVGYCSKECQTQMWPMHKKQCKRAQKWAKILSSDLKEY